MTTRREFIKLAAGTLAMISLPMGLVADEKKEIVKVNIDNTICWYYAPQITIPEFKGTGNAMEDCEAGIIVPYVNLWADPSCNKCMYSKHRPKCIEMFNS